MNESATSPIKSPRKSIGGLIGGEARLLNEHRTAGKAICGNVISRAITYACAVLEVNTSMGLIVSAPTAGSSGIVPGVILALQEEYRISDDRLMDALSHTVDCNNSFRTRARVSINSYSSKSCFADLSYSNTPRPYDCRTYACRHYEFSIHLIVR